MNPILTGTPAGAGTAKGPVKILTDMQNADTFNEGDILVTTMTDPSMIVVMGKAAAIICDTGGLTSHAAIVSREMGLPCIVATKTGTTTLRNNQIISVNGSTGEVFDA